MAEKAAVNPPLQIHLLFRQRYHLGKVFLFKSHLSRFNKLSLSSRPKYQVYTSSRHPRGQCPEHQDTPNGNYRRNLYRNLRPMSLFKSSSTTSTTISRTAGPFGSLFPSNGRCRTFQPSSPSGSPSRSSDVSTRWGSSRRRRSSS